MTIRANRLRGEANPNFLRHRGPLIPSPLRIARRGARLRLHRRSARAGKTKSIRCLRIFRRPHGQCLRWRIPAGARKWSELKQRPASPAAMVGQNSRSKRGHPDLRPQGPSRTRDLLGISVNVHCSRARLRPWSIPLSTRWRTRCKCATAARSRISSANCCGPCSRLGSTRISPPWSSAWSVPRSSACRADEADAGGQYYLST